MIDTRAVGQELQDLQHQIVGRIRKSQETVAGAIKTWARNVQTMTPQIPALPSSEEFSAARASRKTAQAKPATPAAKSSTAKSSTAKSSTAAKKARSAQK